MERKTIIVSAVIAFGVSALVSQIDLRRATSAPSVAAPQPAVAAAGASYAGLLVELDERIAGFQERADGRPDDWLIRMHLGVALLERASLTNQLADFERLQAVLDQAFAIAPAGSAARRHAER
jgi:hypothetical protein